MKKVLLKSYQELEKRGFKDCKTDNEDAQNNNCYYIVKKENFIIEVLNKNVKVINLDNGTISQTKVSKYGAIIEMIDYILECQDDQMDGVYSHRKTEKERKQKNETML